MRKTQKCMEVIDNSSEEDSSIHSSDRVVPIPNTETILECLKLQLK